MTEQVETKISEKTPETQPKVENAQSNNTTITQEAPETQEQINWRKFREQREIERKAKEASDRRAAEKEAEAAALKAAMESLLNRNSTREKQFDSNQFEEEETEDQRIQKRVDAAIEIRLKQEENKRREREQQELPRILQQTCPDFDNVCTTNNLDYLDYHYPEITAGYKHMPDSLEKWQSVYKAVKKFVPQGNIKKEEAKMAQNMQKPQSFSSPTTLQGSQAPGPRILTEEKRQANWERMQREINKLG